MVRDGSWSASHYIQQLEQEALLFQETFWSFIQLFCFTGQNLVYAHTSYMGGLKMSSFSWGPSSKSGLWF